MGEFCSQYRHDSEAVFLGLDFRKSIEFPMVFSPESIYKTLYLGTQYVTATLDGGVHWRNLGDKDLATRTLTPEEAAAVAAAGRFAIGGHGAISSIAPSTVTGKVIWTGSNNGLIYVTQDGGTTWKETDLKLPYNANVVIMDASHSDPAEAYAGVDLHAAGTYTPASPPHARLRRPLGSHYQRTADERTRGQLCAGGSRGHCEKRPALCRYRERAYVSFDDGDHWQSLQLNLPLRLRFAT